MRIHERRLRRGQDDVGVGDEVEAAAGADAVDRRDHRLPDLVVPRRESKLGVSRSARLLAQRLLVATELHDVHSGLERGPVARVHDHAYGRVTVQLAPYGLELAEHGRVHRVPGVGPVEDQPSHRAASLDEEGLVRHQLRGTSRHGCPCHGSGSRGRPSTRSPSTFLLISVVPPSIVFARLRNIPRSSNGNDSA